jgi:hypothetical protein
LAREGVFVAAAVAAIDHDRVAAASRKLERAPLPVDVRVVQLEPRQAENDRRVRAADDVELQLLGVAGDGQAERQRLVGDLARGGRPPVDGLDVDGARLAA